MKYWTLDLTEMIASLPWRTSPKAVAVTNYTETWNGYVEWRRSDETGDHYYVSWDGDGHPLDRTARFNTAAQVVAFLADEFATEQKMKLYFGYCPLT